MPSVPFTDRIADGWRRSADAVWLAFVPVVTALFSVDKVLKVLRMDGFHAGISLLSYPSASSNVWQFVSTPQSGVSVDLPASLGIVAVSFVLTAFLLGGYLGSLRRLLDEDADGFAFVGDCLAYLGPMAVWTGIPSLVTAAVAVVTGGFGSVGATEGVFPLFLLLFVAYAVFGYLLYAAPFLVVLRDSGIVDALRSSYALAVDGGPYASYAFGYVLFALVVSVPLTLVVVNLGVVGLLVGVPLGARLGLAATTATMRFVGDVDDRSPTLREWDDGDGGDEDDGNGGSGRGDADGRRGDAPDGRFAADHAGDADRT